MKTMKILAFLTSMFAVSTALNCTKCDGNGTDCTNNRQTEVCPAGADGLCGRATFLQNGVKKVVMQCVLKTFCVGTIDCLKDGFELGKRYKNATNCVVSCCEGDNCDPPVPLKCYQCQGKGQKCETNSVSCGFKEDRCLKINYKVGSDSMTDERCYQSSQCTDKSKICGLVKSKNTTVKDCMSTCCEKPNCNAAANPDNGKPKSVPSYFLVAFLLALVLKI